MARAIEKRDALGLGARSRVRENAEPARVDLGDEVGRPWKQRPGIAAQIAEVEVIRLPEVLLEDVIGAFHLARIDGDAHQFAGIDELLEVAGIHAEEYRRERRVE